MKILNKIFPVFYKYEEQILNSIEEKLNGKAKEIFRKQINSYNSVQRFWDCKEVNLYNKQYFKIVIDESIRFPIMMDEVKLAKVTLLTNKNLKINVEVWVVTGHIFSLRFNKSPKTLKNDPYRIEKVELLVDPMKEILIAEIDSKVLVDWFKQNTLSSLKVEKAFMPCKTSEIKQYLATNEITISSDYEDLLKICDGCKTDKFEIYGIRKIRQVDTEKRKYYIIAEGKSEYILTFIANSANIYMMDLSDDSEEIIDLGNSFTKALKVYCEL